MASLVTLNSAPYNPYNTSFANIALEGLRMAQNEMARRDQNAQNQFSNYQRSIEFGANVLFRQQEMQLNRRKFDFSVDQALFERKLSQEEQQFRREQFQEGIRQFDVSSGFKEQEIGLRRDEGAFRERVYEEGSPMREAQTQGQLLENSINLDTLQERQRTAPLRELGQRVQMGATLAQSQANLLNAEANVENASTRNQYYAVNKERQAQVGVIQKRISDTRNAINRAHLELADSVAKKRASQKGKKTEQELKIEENIQRLENELSEMNRQLSTVQGSNDPYNSPVPSSPEDSFFESRNNSPVQTIPEGGQTGIVPSTAKFY